MSRSREEPRREKTWIALLLASVAGFVDSAGYIILNGLFTAHMSGNTARLGVFLGRGGIAAGIPLAAAVVLFVFGIALGTVVSELATRRGIQSIAAVVLGLQAILLAAFMVYGGVSASHELWSHPLRGFYVLAALAIISIGLQACALRQIAGRTVRTTYISGVLTNLAQELVNYLCWLHDGSHRAERSYLGEVLGLGSRQESRERTLLLTGIWGSYLVGAISGACTEQRLGSWAFAFPIVALGLAILADLWRPIHASRRTDRAGSANR